MSPVRSSAARELLLVGALVVAALLGTAGAALAQPDPASHFLEVDVLYPALGDRPAQAKELQLLGLLYATQELDYPVKVALLASEQDLTEDPRCSPTRRRTPTSSPVS